MADWPDTAPDRACLVLDFDGTLAPMTADPARSAMPDSTAQIVQGLVGQLGRVAMVSGRQAAFLADRVRIPGVELIGLYGLERVVDGEIVPDDRVAPYEEDLDRAREVLAAVVAEWAGAELEDKGRALGVHWRRADSPDAEQALVRAVQDAAGELAVEEGKMVIELRPPVPADKGTAVAGLAEGFATVVYAGDDVGDLPAFAEVARRGGLGVAVDHGAETDPRVLRAASVVVDGTEGMARWLRAVLDRVT
ncbi:trehalose-phosphatase [Euzebya tangerina]|uniref:trehalose-phosphatase n=1 Tax=Euzebya tangerina TaxID=591198 RepID=UPI0013C33A6D|nr:trehalose-phosphatase [Euzebya tangerina]